MKKQAAKTAIAEPRKAVMVRVPESIHAKLVADAVAQERSVDALVRSMLIKHYSKKRA